MREMDSIPIDERPLAYEILQDFLSQASSPAIEIASQCMYKTSPVKMKEFLENPFYLGRFSETIFSTLKTDLITIFEGGYSQAILGGCLGSGKSTAGVIALLRMVYETGCLWNPHEIYKMSSSDYLMFPGISPSEEIAERNILDKVRSIVSDSEYFQKHFKPVKNSMAHGLEFPNKILIPPGASTAAQIIGGNVLGCFFDEGNFFPRRTSAPNQQGEIKENVDVIYESIKQRMESRFLRRGKLPGIIFIASSKTTPNSFTEKIILKSIGKPDIYVKERAVWEVHPPERFSSSKFRVAIGSETKMSKVLADNEPDPEGMKVIEVPMDFHESFLDDIDKAIRNFAGYATVSITPFIARREKIYECIDKTRVHPFNQEVWDQDTPGIVQWSKIARLRDDGAWEPLHHPQAPRHIHLDLSKNHDRTGFTMGCVPGFDPVQRYGKADIEMAPRVYIDFMLGIQAPNAGEIIYAEIRKLIYEFSQHGFYIKLVSADQYQSISLLQSMRNQGYKTKVISVEAPGPYEALKQALYENRLSMYNYGPLNKELRELQKNWKTGKVDHPPASQGGSKDISDSVASVVATLTENSHSIVDSPVTSRSSEIIFQDEDQWILDGMIAVNSGNEQQSADWRQHAEEVLRAEPEQSVMEWRQHGEKALEQERSTNYDWKKDFQMPFSTG